MPTAPEAPQICKRALAVYQIGRGQTQESCEKKPDLPVSSRLGYHPAYTQAGRYDIRILLDKPVLSCMYNEYKIHKDKVYKAREYYQGQPEKCEDIFGLKLKPGPNS